MTIWLAILIVVAICYVLGRLAATADLPVSARFARAREQLERTLAQRIGQARADRRDDAASTAQDRHQREHAHAGAHRDTSR